jgi:hypothetical protein
MEAMGKLKNGSDKEFATTHSEAISYVKTTVAGLSRAGPWLTQEACSSWGPLKFSIETM